VYQFKVRCLSPLFKLVYLLGFERVCPVDIPRPLPVRVAAANLFIDLPARRIPPGVPNKEPVLATGFKFGIKDMKMSQPRLITFAK